jgi:quinol monooxygenase YgiN
MPTIVATVKLKESKLAEAKAFLKTLAQETLANEPGTLTYTLHEKRGDPTSVVVYEKYESEEAFATHSKNLAAKGAEFASFLDGAPELIFLEEL